MKFFETIENLKLGNGVRRKSWGNGLYIKQRGDLVYLYISGINGARLLHSDEKFSLSDITAEDWEIFNETEQ